MVTTRYGVVQW